ncbi:DUF4221 family protein [Marivirga sp.]|uniref:DUF4221 family protein n=1 Tax=Marivirga sp. TaxID=2018662 RepID=UPI003DA7351E
MKNIIYFISSIIIISFSSCGGGSENGKQKSVINISIDSAMVDAKGEIIDTKYGLQSFDFDDENNFMFKFNTNNRHGLEIIDMNKMELVDFIPFEIEGPNGTGSNVSNVKFVTTNKIAIQNSKDILLFDYNAELINQYEIANNQFKGDSMPAGYRMETTGLFVPSKKTSINLVNKVFSYLRGFAKLDLKKNTREIYWMDDLKQLDAYRVSLTTGGSVMNIRTKVYSLFNDNKYIMCNDMLNELHYYDMQLDSVIHKTYHSQLSGNKNEIAGKIEVESMEELGRIMSSRKKSNSFGEIVYDKTRKQYYRFSSFSTTPDQEEENWNIILTIFDENLNQIHEIGNIELDKVPETYFVKDGKIYIYKNMEDEMGFVIISLN